MSREILRAILKDDREKFDILIIQNAGINEVTEQEKWNYLHRALMLPTMQPSVEMIQHLIDCGINVDAIDVYGNSPLHYACRLKNSKIIKVLLGANIEKNTVNKDGVSPLREALLTKPFDYESIKLLLESGADVYQKIDGGASVKEFAFIVLYEDKELLDLFGKY